MGIIAAIQAFFTAWAKTAECKKSNNEFAAEKDVLKTKKQLAKNNSRQEDLILDMAVLLRKYMNLMTKKDRLSAKNCLRKVKKVN